MQDPRGASYFNQLLIFQITSLVSLPPTLSFSYYSLAYSPIAHHPPPLNPRKVGQFRRPRTRRPGSSGADSGFCGANGRGHRTPPGHPGAHSTEPSTTSAHPEHHSAGNRSPQSPSSRQHSPPRGSLGPAPSGPVVSFFPPGVPLTF